MIVLMRGLPIASSKHALRPAISRMAVCNIDALANFFLQSLNKDLLLLPPAETRYDIRVLC